MVAAQPDATSSLSAAPKKNQIRRVVGSQGGGEQSRKLSPSLASVLSLGVIDIPDASLAERIAYVGWSEGRTRPRI